MPLISIIIPIFNKEIDLEKNLESIINQTFIDIEIILVDDGSTDNSLKICREFESKDNRVVVIEKPNSGVSDARNIGLSIAQGEFIGFVDPDDWIENNMYENMYNKITGTNAEVCICNFSVENNGVSNPILLNFDKEYFVGSQVFNEIVLNMISPKSVNSSERDIMGSVCRMLIRKSVINKYKIKFESGLTIQEDLLFCLELLLNINKVSIDESVNYHYVQNADSAIHQYRSNKSQLEYFVASKIESLLHEKNKYNESINRLSIRNINVALRLIYNEIFSPNTLDVKLDNIKLVCYSEKLQKSFNYINISDITFRKRLVLLALKNKKVKFLFFYYFIVSKVNN
ncbi:glycosyltransferase family 2 protein [Aerococcus urinaeequi]|uniref:glycosyltransferase family 2 protein n=1 Tax=Aerococcus urinaeequi TaxID=51665 RepID=UPI003D6B93B2